MMDTINILIDMAPLLLIFLCYFVRLENKLTSMSKDICWIKRELGKCPRPLENPSR